MQHPHTARGLRGAQDGDFLLLAHVLAELLEVEVFEVDGARLLLPKHRHAATRLNKRAVASVRLCEQTRVNSNS